MRFAVLVFLATGSVMSAGFQEANFAGHWVSRADNGDGTFRETVFVLKQDGAALSGRVVYPSSEVPIAEGAVVGGPFHFVTITGQGTNRRRVEFSGGIAAPDAITIRIS